MAASPGEGQISAQVAPASGRPADDRVKLLEGGEKVNVSGGIKYYVVVETGPGLGGLARHKASFENALCLTSRLMHNVL